MLESKNIRFGELENLLHNGENRLEVFNSDEFHKLLMERIDLLFDGAPKLITVDVFDTLLLRKPESEFRHFLDIAERVSDYLKSKDINKSTEEILIARYIATEINYRVSIKVKGCREGSLNEIYSSIIHTAGINGVDISELVQIELDHEKESLYPNHGLWSALKKYALEGSKVILVSDMYMHAYQIEELMRYHFEDYEELISELISSADNKYSKASGIVFKEIVKSFSTKAENCLHLGDNFKGDYQKPIDIGYKAIFLPKPHIFEKQVLADKTELLDYYMDQNINFKQWVK